jgi:hypothetical protein
VHPFDIRITLYQLLLVKPLFLPKLLEILRYKSKTYYRLFPN